MHLSCKNTKNLSDLRWEVRKTPENKAVSLPARAFALLLFSAAAYLIIRYLLPVLLPFILAFMTAGALEPLVKRLSGALRLKRRLASAAAAFTVLSLAVLLAFLLLRRAASELMRLLREMPTLLENAQSALRTAAEALHINSGAFSEVFGKTDSLPAVITERVFSAISSAAETLPKALLAAAAYVIAVFFISGSYGEIKRFLMRCVPERFRGDVRLVKQNAADTAVRWLKAQILLMCVTFSELTASFLLMKIDFAALPALFIALVDALPVLGTGTVLLPWAALCLITGRTVRAAALALTYAVTLLVRSFLEPRLVGGMLGVHQVPVLIAIYAGFCFFGVGGMIMLPLLLAVGVRLFTPAKEA